ncbi:beta-hydroxyacyl-ACP dehydratase [Patiriisocius marinistellae]|uniref:Beta-hydroxyacyl-ACP dehydratase n=1 Tax=Patiriisocius marinistellae TaxID=2494560 RepID=A0A5J4FUS1_9FLAO|nr:hydroxymyristoyl-ACP dehydratase [Patiriisocius marinistellae]GEQ86407.1 beta-hydroxyacyl-ACP dehydratase [Patiriisocius marinistellae]
MDLDNILAKLPYSTPFLFVDSLSEVNESGATGFYKFKEDSFFYKGHFKNNPITPGVILTECMAQIGVVCLGIFLMEAEILKHQSVAMSTTNIDFYKPVFPGEKVKVVSEKMYFRFNKLKCKVRMLNEKNEVVALGEISGMIG